MKLIQKTRKINPRLKAGVKFWRSSLTGQLFIGTRFRNFLIPNHFESLEIESALNNLARSRLDFEENQVLISALRGLHLIDSESTELSYQYKENRKEDISSLPLRSIAQENFLARFEVEAQGVSFDKEVLDGGIKRVLNRRQYFVEVHGVGRLVFPLLANLISSGFDNCAIATKSDIYPTDICGGFLRRSDSGLGSNQKLVALKEEASLYPEILGSGGKPDLIISIGSPAPEVMQNWLRLQIPQFFVDYENPGELRIGPFVQPGDGACYNCLVIGEGERGWPANNSLAGQRARNRRVEKSELTASLAAYGASLIALEVIKIADTESSNLHQKTMLISMLQFLEPQVTSWERSPRCGCNWS